MQEGKQNIWNREFDTCDGEKVLEVEAEPYFFCQFVAILYCVPLGTVL